MIRVESETFKNHKFRDVMAQVDQIIQESHRLNLYQLLPSVITELNHHKIAAGASILSSYVKRRNLRDFRAKFAIWKTNAGMVKYFTHSFKNAIFSRALTRVMTQMPRKDMIRLFHSWK